MSYKRASRLSQSRLTRPVGDLIGDHTQELSLGEIRQNLIAKLVSLRSLRLGIPKGTHDRRRIGQEIGEIEAELSALNLKLKSEESK